MKSPNYPANFICRYALCCALFILAALNVTAQQKAFPTAYGGGSYVEGGRGGNVYHVTKLTDDGSVGTLRWANDQPRPATIVFDVSGTINLVSTLHLGGAWNQTDNRDDYLTIAGQSAPMGGITLTSDNPNVKIAINDATHIILRYFRIRLQRDNNVVALGVRGDWHEANNMIFDHLSISYGGWSAMGAGGNNSSNITVQNCVFAESKTGVIFGDSDVAANSYNNSFNGNYFYNVSHRHPNPNSLGRIDVINNVVQNPYFRLDSNTHSPQLNHINNYVAAGNWTTLPYNRMNRDFDQGNNQIYTSGNIIDNNIFENPNADNKLIWSKWNAGSETAYLPANNFRSTQYPLLGSAYPILSASEAYNDVIVNQDKGASKSLNADGTYSDSRDANDIAYFAKIAEGEGAYEPYTAGDSGTDRSFFYEQRYFDFLASISTTPINTRPNNFYSSNPHIPEAFLVANGLVGSPTIHNVIAPSGYTWLEEYLNGVDRDNDLEVVNASAGQDISICQDESVTLTASGGSTYLWNTGATTATITVSPAATTTYTVTAYSATGTNSDTDEVTVTVNPLPTANAGADVTICRGTSVTLTATGGGSYLWSNGATSASITVNPNNTSTYSVDVTQNGCTATDSLIVTVNPLPTVNAGTDITINLGESTTLNASGANTYSWNTGATGSSIEVSPTETASYTVTGTDVNGCINSDSVIITVIDTSVTANAGTDATICEGNSTTLTATGGATYLWSNGATTASIVVSPSSTTTYAVTAYDPTRTISDSDEVLVTVIPMPVANAGSDVSTCRGTSVTLTAAGGGNYLWSTGASTRSITVNPNNTTTYSVEVTQNGCSVTDSVTVTVNPLPSVNAGTDLTIYLGESTTLSATGANTYLWNTGATSPTIDVSPTETTSYTVTGTDVNGCINSDTVIVTVIDTSVTANAGADVTICEGNSTTLTASGGGTYLWNTGDTAASIVVSPSSTTTYTVTAYDPTGTNSDNDEVEVTVNPSPIANAGSDISICRGASVTLTASGGGSYLWSNGETTSNITVNPNNTTIYTVEVTQNGCSSTDDVRVTVNPLPVANAGSDVSICEGASVTLTATGVGNYLWSNGATTSSITVSPNNTTTYSVEVTQNGCSSNDDVIVAVNPIPVADAGSDVSICRGTSVTLTATGGGNYLWSNGETTSSITVNPNNTTTYSVEVSQNGCTSTDDVRVTVNPLPSVNAGPDVIIDLGETVNLSATGANTYLWSTGATTAIINVSPTVTTTYTVTGTNSNGCSRSRSVTVNVRTGEGVTADAGTDVSICEGNTATLTASGGASYLWSTGETTASINVSPSATITYTVTVYDATGLNSDADDVTVSVNPLPVANAGSDVSTCRGTSVTLTASGGGNYLWSNGATTSSITVNPNNTTTYSVEVTQNGCSSTDNVRVTVIPSPIANAGSDVSICIGTSVTLNASGGGSYLWSNGATTSSITVNPNNTTTYSVEVTQNGCSSTDDVIVTVNPLPVANAGDDVSTCRGTGVTLSASGGGSYLWSNGATTSSITVNPNNTTIYSVEVTQNGCSSTDDVRVTVNPLPSVNAGADETINLGESVTLGATGAATYVWNTGATTSIIDVSPTSTTTYTVTGTNSNGCSKTDSVTVNVQTGSSVIANAGADISICNGSSATLTATGGTTYLWSTGATTSSITVSPSSTTTYTVTVYDSTGLNSDSDDVRVTVKPLPVANAGADVSTCRGTSVTLFASGGVSYLWSNGSTNSSITVNPNNTTTYSVEVTQNGCTDTDDVIVTVNPLPSVNAGTDVTVTNGQSTTLIATGAGTYTWNTGATTATINVSPSETTTYTVTGTNANGCSKTDSVTVNVESANGISANAGADVSICNGNSTVLTANGGSSYLWSTGATTASITVSPNSTTTYTVTAYDATGVNSDTDDVRVTVNQPPSIFISPDFTINFGQIVTLYAFGGTSYVWSTGETANSITITPNTTTTYSVVGTSNGCEATSSVTITVMDETDYVSHAGPNRATCTGYGVTLTATGGDSYLWSTGETTQSIVVNPNSTTTYSVRVYTSTAEITDDVIVNVNPTPIVNITNGNEVTILQGEYVTLSATGANRYEWNNGATLANVAVNPTGTTTYSVTGFIGDCSDVKGVTVNVVPAVMAFAGDDKIICLNEEITLTATGGDEFLWNNGETTASITVTPTEDTEYSVTVYNDLDYGTADVMVYVNDCSGVENPENPEYFELLVYPNPTSGILNIKISGLMAVSNIALFDITGKMLFQENLSNDTQQDFEKKIDLSPYSDGIYILKLIDGTHSITKKIVLQR